MSLDMYQEQVLDHYKRPRNFGELPGATATAHDVNPLCGDEVTMHLKVEDGRVADVRFQGRGCTISTAAASMLTAWVKGKTVEEALAVDRGHMERMLGIPVGASRVKCLMLGPHVLRLALGKGEAGRLEG